MLYSKCSSMYAFMININFITFFLNDRHTITAVLSKKDA